MEEPVKASVSVPALSMVDVLRYRVVLAVLPRVSAVGKRTVRR
jgi:hypothetical protein